MGSGEGRIYLTRTKPSSSDSCAIYTEVEDATPVASVVMNRCFCPETKLELGDPISSA